MNEKPTRILHVIGKLGSGGIESFMMNVYRHIDRKKIQFDFVVFRDTREFYDEEVAGLGGRKIVLGKELSSSPVVRLKRVLKFIVFLGKHPEYEIVQIHMSNPASAFEYIIAAKLLKRKILAHSHASGDYRSGKIRTAAYALFRKIVCFAADDLAACSKAAANWMFTEKYAANAKIIYNGIDFKKFAFNEKKRHDTRMRYRLENSFVIGHIGRFAPEKNQEFLVEILKNIRNEKPVKLLLAGDGMKRKDVEHMVKQNGLKGLVVFTGECHDISPLLQAMDIFVLPSLYEGFGIVALEAQAAGLPCILSDSVPKEVKCTECVSFLSLDSGAEEWEKEIMRLDGYRDRKTEIEEEKRQKYDIQSAARSMLRIYKELQRSSHGMK